MRGVDSQHPVDNLRYGNARHLVDGDGAIRPGIDRLPCVGGVPDKLIAQMALLDRGQGPPNLLECPCVNNCFVFFHFDVLIKFAGSC